MTPGVRALMRQNLIRWNKRHLRKLVKGLFAPPPTLASLEMTVKKMAAFIESPEGQALLDKHLQGMEVLSDAKPTHTEASQAVFNGEPRTTAPRRPAKAKSRTRANRGKPRPNVSKLRHRGT